MDAYSSSGEDVVLKPRKPYTITKQRERWTDDEHNRFLEALKLYGRAWQRIQDHIGTKTAVQIRSHAQKFFSKLEKESLVKGVPIGQTLDIDIPPPRPKRKPSNPYPRKNNAGTPALHSGSKDGKPLISVAFSHGKQVPNFDNGPLPEEAPCSSVSTENRSSISVSVLKRNSCASREFVPSVKEVTTQDETNKSFMTTEIENQKLEKDDGKHTQKTNGSFEASKLENSGPSKLVQAEKTNGLSSALTIDEMQGTQNYPRHITVHVVDGKLGTSTQNPSQDKMIQDSLSQPTGGVGGQPNIFTNSAASNTSGSQSNTARSSIHQSFPPCPPPFTHHNQDDYQSYHHMSSTFSSLIVSTLLQNPAAHAAASFAATFWPYANTETSADSLACSQGGFPCRQLGSPPSVAAIAAATVAAATAWWGAHGLLPLCAPLHTGFACPVSATAVPTTNIGEVPPKTDQGEITVQNLTLQDQILDREYSEALQAQHSASKSPAVSSSESEESGDAKLNTSSNANNPEMNQASSENLDSNEMKDRKLVDRSSCGSNTTSSSEEADIAEKDEKEKEDSKAPDTNHLATETSHLDTEPCNRRSRNITNLTDYWKEVSEEGRIAFQALFSREVLPQSFSPPHYLINKDNQMDNIKESNRNTDNKDHLDSNKCSSSCDWMNKNLPLVQNKNEEELLTLSLGQGMFKTRRTGFKPYKRCLVEAKESSTGAGNQVEEKSCKRICLEGDTLT